MERLGLFVYVHVSTGEQINGSSTKKELLLNVTLPEIEVVVKYNTA
jgi:sulfur carrier protein ThiS